MKKFLALILMLVLTGCGEKNDAVEKTTQNNEDVKSPIVNLTIDDNKKNIEVLVNQEVELQLVANPTTGNNWNFVTYVVEDGVVEELAEEYIPDENPDNKLGVGGKSVYRIKVLKEGEILITANYEKVSETTKKDDNDFSVTVTIK